MLVHIVMPLIPQRELELISNHLALAVRVGLGKERRGWTSAFSLVCET